MTRFHMGLAVSFGLIVAVLLSVQASQGEPPTAPQLSKVIPADELVAQAKLTLAELGPLVAGDKEFADGAEKFKKEANTLIVLALVLGKHDAEHELKAAAPAVLPAAQALAKAKNAATAKAELAAVNAALASRPTAASELKWEKVASLGRIMEQAESLQTEIRTGMRRFEPKAADNARLAATLAAIGQASIYDTHEVKDPADLPKWYQLSAGMRDAAGELSAKFKAADEAGATAALSRLQKSCADCHEVFRSE